MSMFDAWDLRRRGWTDHLLRHHAPPADGWEPTGDPRKPKRLWTPETVTRAEAVPAFQRALSISLRRRRRRSCDALRPNAPRLGTRGTDELLHYLARARASRQPGPVLTSDHHWRWSDAHLRLAAELYDDLEARLEHQRRRHTHLRRSSPGQHMTPLDLLDERLTPEEIDDHLGRQRHWAWRHKQRKETK